MECTRSRADACPVSLVPFSDGFAVTWIIESRRTAADRLPRSVESIRTSSRLSSVRSHLRFNERCDKNYVLSARYTRKQVLHAIEDAGFPNSQGSEYYIIGNPGEGLYKQQADMFGTIALKPQRQYDALEIRVNQLHLRSVFYER